MLKEIIKVAMSGTVGKVLRPILDAISPTIRAMLVKFISELKEKAEATPNEADDALVELLIYLFKITDAELLAGAE